MKIFLYGFFVSLVIHAGVFLLLVRLNEKWGWVSFNQSYVEVTLVTQKGPAAKTVDAGKPEVKASIHRQPKASKQNEVTKLKQKKAPVQPAENKLEEPAVNHLPGESAQPESAITMIADLQASAPHSALEKSEGEAEGVGKSQGRAANENAVAEAGGEGGGFNSRRNYLDMVRLKIEKQKKYPDMAQQRNLEGQVTVEFDINLDGRISEPSVSKSSGFQSLDQAALDAVKKASPFASPPRQFFSESIHINLPIRFELIHR